MGVVGEMCGGGDVWWGRGQVVVHGKVGEVSDVLGTWMSLSTHIPQFSSPRHHVIQWPTHC